MFCGSCLLAREWISLQISGNQSQEALESALDQVCDRVVRRNREDCKEFVNQKLDFILHLLQTESDGRTFCTKLDLCGQPKAITSPVADGLEREVESEPVTLFPQCFICKQVMHWLNTELRDNRTEQRFLPLFNEFVQSSATR